MASERTFVIVGASLAGAKAAQTLREEGFDGRIVLVGEERERPYERPPLSKGLLLGKEEQDKIYVHPPEWYAENSVELLLGVRATELDRGSHVVRLADGRSLRYDRLLLTTGASPRPLPVPGADRGGVHYLRTVDDSRRLQEELRAGGRQVAVVGGGWIGLETAAAAREYDNAVTLIEPEPTPLYRVLGPELGGHFADLHRRHEVRLRLGTAVSEVSDGGVVTDAGDRVEADVVIVGVGIRPNVELAEAAGLAIEDGIAVDAALRSSDPDIFAAGDVAAVFNPFLGRRIRVEHWANALNSGPAAARAMLGQEVVYDEIPYFFSDQYDLGMEYSGVATPGEYDEVVFRGSVEDGEFVAFWLAHGRVLAGMNVNVWDVTDDVRSLIRSGEPVDRERLTDPKAPLV